MATPEETPPPRHRLTFKHAEHPKVAGPPPEDAAPKKLGFKAAEFTTVNEPAGTPAPQGTDPIEILRINRELEKSRNMYNPEITARPRSRRMRDYYVVLITGILGAAFVGLLLPGAVIFILAGALIFCSGITWIMVFNMDDY
jgi:hypothetical protein